jgi:Fe-S-cluster containining protein
MKNPWYHKGLSFRCTGCGKCCTGSPGYVWITREDVKNIIDFLEITKEEFLKIYTRRVMKRLSLKEKTPSYDCIFLKDNKCLIYKVRPLQCSTFPWWSHNISSKETWEKVKETCEGIDKSKHYSQKQIEENLFEN